jgi:hypothetical protein
LRVLDIFVDLSDGTLISVLSTFTGALFYLFMGEIFADFATIDCGEKWPVPTYRTFV